MMRPSDAAAKKFFEIFEKVAVRVQAAQQNQAVNKAS
jgi:hypothetical protein